MKNLFHILKNDRQALLGLLVIAVSAGIMFFASEGRKDGTDTTEDDIMEESKAQRTTGNRSSGKEYYAVPAKEIRLQTFDPNTADSTVLLGLGLHPWQVRNIYRYRANGGIYTCPEDFARLYGLTAKKYRELLPYIRISDDYLPASKVYPSPHQVRTNSALSRLSMPDSAGSNAATPYPQKLRQGQTIPLNLSDTITLRKVPGIGAHFARKIVRYRERLGGFVSNEQLLEIEDFPESALPYLTVRSDDDIHRLNINTATNEQLRRHPYINYLMARQICDYRRVHGKISDIDVLRLLPTFKPTIIQKLKPYITY